MRYFKKIIGAFTLIAVLFSPCLAKADVISDLQAQKEAAAAEAEQARIQAKQKQKEVDSIESQIANVDYQISSVSSAIYDSEIKLVETNNQIDALNKEIQLLEDNLASDQKKIDNLVASWYMEGDSSGVFNALISSNSLSEVITRQEYYDSVKRQIEDSIDKINKLKAEVELKKSEQENNKINLQKYKDSQEAQKLQLDQQKNVKDRLLNDTENMVAELKAEEKEALKKEAEIEAKVNAEINKRSKQWVNLKGTGQRVSAGERIGSMGNTGNSFGAHLHFEVRDADGNRYNPRNYLGSSMVWPTDSRRVTQEYGSATCDYCGYSFHTGMDIGATTPGVPGDPIYSAANGEIVMKQWYGGYGYAVVVMHDSGIFTLYGHLSN